MLWMSSIADLLECQLMQSNRRRDMLNRERQLGVTDLLLATFLLQRLFIIQDLDLKGSWIALDSAVIGVADRDILRTGVGESLTNVLFVEVKNTSASLVRDMNSRLCRRLDLIVLGAGEST